MTQPKPTQREYEADYYSQVYQAQAKPPPQLSPEDKDSEHESATKNAEQAASQYSVSQSDQLLQSNVTRGDGPVPDANYAAYTHEQLHDMVNTNLDPVAIDDYGRAMNKLGNILAEASNAFTQATSATQADWQGPAAEQAHGFFAATGNYAATASSASQLSSNHYSQQAAAASHAQTAMPPPSGFDQNKAMDAATKQIQSGNVIAGFNAVNAIPAQQAKADADHAQAVQVMQGMDSTYHSTAGTQPALNPPPPISQDGQTTASSASASMSGGSHGGGFAGGAGGPGVGGAGGGAPGGGSGGAYAPGGGVGAGSGAGGGGGASLGSGAISGGGSLGGPAGGFRGPAGGFSPGGIRPSGDMSMLSGGAGGTGGGSGGDIARSNRSPGSGFAGSRVSGKSGSSVGSASEEELGNGKGSGAGKTGAAGERVAPGGSAASAKAGSSGAPGAGGGGKKKEEDKEHERRIDLAEDAEEVFGVNAERGPDGEVIAPPVLGA